GGAWSLRVPQCKFIFIKRKCEFWRNRNKIFFIIWRLIYERYKIKYMMDIPAKTKIGMGFKIEHIGGIVINPEAVLGENVSILNNVLIGSEKRGRRKGVPTIGNNVYLATNVVIVGNVKIGNNVLIAANTFVNFNVPDNSIVVGNKIILNENATVGYL
ncbi:serine acetyltransferase, partial [Ligilactobacillus equi]|uniref:serine acetyltransferase n=1 Tax=Ligilactobacillus equi TaxID=137357 RepID=UPI000553F232